jgi:hypothetical protein
MQSVLPCRKGRNGSLIRSVLDSFFHEQMFPFSLFACSSGKQAVFLAQPLWRMKGPLTQYLRRSKNSVRNEDKHR